MIAIGTRTDGNKFFKWVRDKVTQEENIMVCVQLMSDRDVELELRYSQSISYNYKNLTA